MGTVIKTSQFEELKKNGIRHNIQAGLTIAVRKDIGGHNMLDSRASALAREIKDMTAEQAGRYFAELEELTLQKIKDRQSPTIEYLNHCVSRLSHAQYDAHYMIEDGRFEEAARMLRKVVATVMCGETVTLDMPDL